LLVWCAALFARQLSASFVFDLQFRLVSIN
jgi:hypothetical protein